MYFPTTQWSLLAEASANGETAARAALEALCRRYWSPLHRFICARGHSETEAEDLTQRFLLHLLEHSTLQRADPLRGRFRSFLCGSLVRFLSDEYDRRRAQKRGGRIPHQSLDREGMSFGATADPGAVLFDRDWALTILENALGVVEAEYRAIGSSAQFAVLRRFLPGSWQVPSYEAATAELGVNLPGFKSELHRLRLRFRAAVRQEIAATVTAPHETDAEMEHLQQVLLDPGNDFGEKMKPSPPIS